MSVINHATIQFMTTLTLGRKSLFTIIRKLNGHPLVIQVYLSMNILIISIKKATNCINLHVPKRKVSKNQLKLRSKPWINSYTQRLMNYRDNFFTKIQLLQTNIYIVNLGIV